MRALIIMERYSCGDTWTQDKFDDPPIENAYLESYEKIERSACQAHVKTPKSFGTIEQDGETFNLVRAVEEETWDLQDRKEEGWQVEKIEDNIAYLTRTKKLMYWFIDLPDYDSIIKLLKEHSGSLQDAEDFDYENYAELVFEL